ncbi:amidohydrolase [Candidatus Koribacter versatilis Ellin345]|uniref:Amidohydrolase n=1 Tax=Koribacter versatilis (strain Ellin345) TaxID=204669 RepID=Q1ILN8_KORVE|nr:amidohydrolase family protein [Candidatus Koribacter versatilis]ABF42212.1 amidohydrolase [Candidatus Koribacter versatilis Ellin345]
MKTSVLKLFCAVLLAASAFAQNDAAAKVKENDPPADVPADATRSTFLMMGNKAGQEAVWKTPDGVTHALFEFNDRGRGPRQVSDYHFDAKGNVLSRVTHGHDYLKSPADESFSVDTSGSASWKNPSEQGSKHVSGPAFYLGMSTPPMDTALLVQAALANHGSIALLPEGEARVTKVVEKTVEANGKKATVAAYSITGLDFSPSTVWLDDKLKFFAGGGTWAMVIREGFEPAAKTLVDAQQEIDAKRSRELAQKLMHHPSGDILIHDVALFDSQSGKLILGQDVRISSNKIKSVTPTALDIKATESVIDGRGKYLIPGIWDMHAHVGDNDGLLNLQAGVTTVRDMGNDIDDLMSRRKRIEAGEELGTRIIACGLIDGPGPYQGPTKILAGNEKEARDFVDKFAALGYPQIKIYSSMKPELVPVIIDEAHKHNMRVSGHIPAGMIASQAVEEGYNEIQHANFLMLNFLPDVKNTETTARFTAVAQRGADVDVNSQAVKDFIKLLQDKNVDLDVTMSVFEEMLIARPGHISPTLASVADRLPPQIRRGALNSGLPVPSGMDQKYKDSWANTERMVKAMYDAGIPIESGTDAMAGFALDREFELHEEIGIPPAKVLQDATLGAAKIMSKDAELGSIAPGKLADVVLLDADPTQSTKNLRRTNTVIKDGVIYYPAEIDRELGIKP